ncbi:MAG: PD40 domain-containing protein [Planctomycetes bacterium]|nr:PD40 domain-containing protein [Planctomycetota bacterium]
MVGAAIPICLAIWAFGSAPPAGDGIAALWRFDGSLADEAGRIRDDLTARDGTGREIRARFVSPVDVPGASSSALALGVAPGDAEFLTAPSSGDLRLGPTYTIEAWIHPTSLAAWNRIALAWGAASDYAFHLAIHDGRLSLYHGQSDGRYVFAEGGALGADRWYHIAATARRDDANPSASALRVFLNGRLAGEGIFDGTIRTLPDEPVGIGDSGSAFSPGIRFRGYIDELAIRTRALSPEEIQARYAPRAEALRRIEVARRAEQVSRFDALGVREIVFAERTPGRDPAGHYYANFGYSCIDPSYWIHGADGGRLTKLDLRTGETIALIDDPAGAVRDPDVHPDGRRILFSYRRGGSHHYNLHEIGADGTGLRRITDGPWDDIEPAYLPDGGIIFCSTRCKRWIGCWLAPSATLHRCDADGGNIRILSSGAFTENTPAVLPDGRILYTRWEYVNRDPVSFHHLWTMDPDGSMQMVYFGNMRPGGVFIDARPIPGTDSIALIHSPGHGMNEHAGVVSILSPRLGPDATRAMRAISRDGNLRDPFPLSEDAFLVARGRQVLLLDARGRTEILFQSPSLDVHEPRALVPHPRAPILPPRTDPASATATLVLADVRSGRAMADVPSRAIRKLLVMEELPKPANFHGGGSQPIGHGVTSTLKRILGTVPVEPDGSAYFEVPALRSIYFAALDERDRSVKQMRSFVTLQPGETAGCVGCHEPRTQVPPRDVRPGLLALARGPSRIEPIPGAPEIPDFPRDVQPILDRHCVRCHDAGRRDGGATFSGDRGPVFSLAYYDLFLHWQVRDTAGDPGDGSGRQPGNDRPYGSYSSASPLMEKIDGRHHDVSLSPRERMGIRLWIDAGAPYAGTYAAYGTGQVGGCWGNNEPVRVMADDWASTPPAREAIRRRCGACHPGDQLPAHVTARIPLDPWGDMLSWTRPLSRFSRHRIFDLTRPEHSLVLLAPLARQAGGLAEDGADAARIPARPVVEDRARPPRPIAHPAVFRDAGDPDYLAILAHIREAKETLDGIKRFDMPGFRPNEHYVREMKRYGVLPATFDRERDPIDVYAADAAYWRSLWYLPAASP